MSNNSNELHQMIGLVSHLVQKEFCCVMESKGRKGQCLLYNKKWEREPQYKGWASLEEMTKWKRRKEEWMNFD